MSRPQSALSLRKYGKRVPPYSVEVAEYCRQSGAEHASYGHLNPYAYFQVTWHRTRKEQIFCTEGDCVRWGCVQAHQRVLWNGYQHSVALIAYEQPHQEMDSLARTIGQENFCRVSGHTSIAPLNPLQVQPPPISAGRPCGRHATLQVYAERGESQQAASTFAICSRKISAPCESL